MPQDALEFAVDLLVTIVGGSLIFFSLFTNFHVTFPGGIHIILFTLGALFMWRGLTRSPA